MSSLLTKFERELLADDWPNIRNDLEVKILPSPDAHEERYVLCRSRDAEGKGKQFANVLNGGDEAHLTDLSERIDLIIAGK